MINNNKLNIGDTSENGQITIIDEDRLCYLVKSTSRGAYGIRTISKSLLSEYVSYFANNPDASANDARDALSGNSDIDKFEYGYTSTLKVMAQMVLGKMDITTTKDVSIIKGKTGHPLQQIFYGAPGTGKSHTINEITEQQPKENVFRTTFHPDSDYSTFVGCYKPTTEVITSVSLHKLHELYPEFKGKVGNRPLQRFITKYYNSFRLLTEKEAESVFDKIETPATVTAEVPKIMAAIDEIPSSSSISYSFVPQSFTKAYLRAWQTTDPVYLIIEEINRGNCAQIFGDLFQLLDRKCDGFSEYPIKADNDLAAYLAEKLSDSPRTDIPELVKSGEELVLPSNLYIWATMNTSDQSLFPIDSAFKRRWEWKYMPINNHEDKGYQIEIGSAKYDWWGFLVRINHVINDTTNSEDKKLGYFFAKAKDKTIDAEQFVGKVLFYLWNDVFKSYGFDDPIFSKGDNKKFEFSNFFMNNGTPNTDTVNLFLRKLEETIKMEELPMEIKPNSQDNGQGE